ncbi:MAG: hypothetical protein WEB88_09100, partial [Gemmatimonadota bacterium]
DAIDARFQAVDERFDAIDARFQAVDERFDAIDTRLLSIEERFIGVDDQFRTLTIRMEFFEQRVDHRLHRLTNEMTLLRELTEQIDTRTRGTEIGVGDLNARVDTLAEDMRQRFRVVNDRLAAVA